MGVEVAQRRVLRARGAAVKGFSKRSPSVKKNTEEYVQEKRKNSWGERGDVVGGNDLT